MMIDDNVDADYADYDYDGCNVVRWWCTTVMYDCDVRRWCVIAMYGDDDLWWWWWRYMVAVYDCDCGVCLWCKKIRLKYDDADNGDEDVW